MTPSVVDWCEPNYVFTPLVAEFWNTVSSLLITVAGIAGAIRWGGRAEDRRFQIAFGLFAFVGLGSAAFHGTLLRVTQALDELPMVYFGLVAVWILLHRTRPAGEGTATAWAFALIAVGFTAGYGLLPAGYFELFLGGYALCIAFMIGRSIQLSMRPQTPPHVWNMCLAAVGFYVGGFCLFWLPEVGLFGCEHPLKAMQLHSWWHITSIFGGIAWLRWAVLDRELAMGRA